MHVARVRRHSARLVRLLRRPVGDQWLVVRAVWLLGISRWQIRRHGLQAVQQHLGERMAESPREIPPNHATEATRIGWAVTQISMYTPWTSNCFPQALAAQRLLARKNIDATVYFGVRLDSPAQADSGLETDGFAAHAWTQCGEKIITGARGVDAFNPIVWFSTYSQRS